MKAKNMSCFLTKYFLPFQLTPISEVRTITKERV